MSTEQDNDIHFMQLALALAEKGQGSVEPNPMVGCVIVKDGQIIGQGYHQQFGGPHAEVNALAGCSSEELTGSTVYVTLEPCCHQGKTPPCTEALLKAKPSRVVVAMQDPFPKVQGGGIQAMISAGIQVSIGVCGEQASRLNAPYLKRQRRGVPWLIAKWAMTLDGKMATASGSSKWISSEEARAEVHRLRGRCDGVLIGSHTAKLDDPLLTTRPPGLRTAARIVFDGQASLNLSSRLVETISEAPLLVAAASTARSDRLESLSSAGCEIVTCPSDSHAKRMESLLKQLSQRGMTNVLVEGGSQLLGLLWDMQQIDEVHAYIAPKIAGGQDAISPIGGQGILGMEDAARLERTAVYQFGDTLCIRGFTGF